MASIPPLEIRFTDSAIEFQALITEREGMIAENLFRDRCGNSATYGDDSFIVLAERIRALKQGVDNDHGPRQA